MAVIFTNKSKIFDHKNNLIILFKQNNKEKIVTKQEGDFYFLLANEKVVGINIFNYKNYFTFNEEGFHLVPLEIKKYLLDNFHSYLKEEDFDNFFKIGKVIEILNHPKSEKLKLLKVEFVNKTLQIITNIQNIKKENKYLFALDGSVTVTGIQIKEDKVLNELSQGMIVSYKTLGINKEEIIDCNKYNLNDDFIF